MTKELANFLKQAADHCNSVEGIEICDDYIGRGMNTPTYAVVVKSYGDALGELLLNVIQYIKETDKRLSFEKYESLAFVPDVADMGMLRTDNMGHDIVIY